MSEANSLTVELLQTNVSLLDLKTKIGLYPTTKESLALHPLSERVAVTIYCPVLDIVAGLGVLKLLGPFHMNDVCGVRELSFSCNEV